MFALTNLYLLPWTTRQQLSQMVTNWFDSQAFQEELKVREKGGHFRQLPTSLGPLCRQPVRGLRGPEGLQGRQRRGRTQS